MCLGLITRLALFNVVDITGLESEWANPRANFDKKLLDAMKIRKVKGIWLKRDEDPESSSKPKRVNTHVQKKTPPLRKARRLTTIKESSLNKSLDEESGSTKDHTPQTFLDLEYSKVVEVPPKELTLDRHALTLSFEVEKERPAPIQSPEASRHPPATNVTSSISLKEVLQAAEDRYRKVLLDELNNILALILKKFDKEPTVHPHVAKDSPCPP